MSWGGGGDRGRRSSERRRHCVTRLSRPALQQRLLGVVFDQTGNPVEALEALRTALHLAMEEDTCDQSKVSCMIGKTKAKMFFIPRPFN